MSTAAAGPGKCHGLAETTSGTTEEQDNVTCTGTAAAAHTFIGFLYLLKPPLGKIVPFVTVWVPLLQTEERHCKQAGTTSGYAPQKQHLLHSPWPDACMLSECPPLGPVQ